MTIPRPEDLQPTVAFDSYWRFAAERLRVFYQMARGLVPCTEDPVIEQYRFTNTYRVSDRVSQYLIREVHSYGSQTAEQLIARTLLFKVFNKIETWEVLRLDQPEGSGHTTESLIEELDTLFATGISIFNPAYIMANPPFGQDRKHQNYVLLIRQIVKEGGLEDATSLADLYRRLLAQPGLGKFLAFQFAIDLNYSDAFTFDEADFVVAGPGALDGISKCFAAPGDYTPEQIIHGVTEAQWRWFARLEIEFPGLYGRPLQPIDCQNLFCEISKYCRVAHPEIVGVAGRTKIKQTYKPSPKAFPWPVFPTRWGLDPFNWREPTL